LGVIVIGVCVWLVTRLWRQAEKVEEV
jgi:hypothetical protein